MSQGERGGLDPGLSGGGLIFRGVGIKAEHWHQEADTPRHSMIIQIRSKLSKVFKKGKKR